MKQFFTALSFTAILCFSSILSAGETFTDPAEWEAAICGITANDSFDDLTGGVQVSVSFSAYPAPQIRPWGTVVSNSEGEEFGSGEAFDDGTFLGFEDDAVGLPQSAGVLVSGLYELTFTPDPANGNLEGFCLEYLGAETIITIFDGTDVVDTITVPRFVDLTSNEETTNICWLNSDQENVTSFEIAVTMPEIGEQGAFINFDYSFGDGCDPPEETCLSQLQDLIVDLGSIGPTGDSCDDQKIACALWYLDCATHESFWGEDGDSVVSCEFFYYAKKGNKYLTWVSSDNAEVNQVLEDIQSVLSCIAENEIMAATAAGGDTDYLDWAAYYQDCADYCQEIGNYRKAAKLRKWAWLYASWA